MKLAQVLVCVAAVGLLWSCASSSNSPQAGRGVYESHGQPRVERYLSSGSPDSY